MRANTSALSAIPEAAEGLIDGAVLSRILDDHLAGRRNLYRIVYCLDVFRAWRARYANLTV